MKSLRLLFLFVLMMALFAGIGAIFRGAQGLVFGFLLAVLVNLVSYWNSDRMVLRLFGAQPVDPNRSGHLIATVAELAKRAAIPAPRLYLIESAQPNAFATGRNPKHAAIAVTSSLLKNLTRDEAIGVLAHEIAHIRNRDTLIMTVAATLAGSIGLAARLIHLAGGRGSGAGRSEAALAVLCAPLAAFLIQMAISRSREYEADRVGALLVGGPFGLAGALARLDAQAQAIPNRSALAHPASAHLFIVNPFAGGSWRRLFSTHPPTGERIRRLLGQADPSASVAPPRPPLLPPLPPPVPPPLPAAPAAPGHEAPTP